MATNSVPFELHGANRPLVGDTEISGSEPLTISALKGIGDLCGVEEELIYWMVQHVSTYSVGLESLKPR